MCSAHLADAAILQQNTRHISWGGELESPLLLAMGVMGSLMTTVSPDGIMSHPKRIKTQCVVSVNEHCGLFKTTFPMMQFARDMLDV